MPKSSVSRVTLPAVPPGFEINSVVIIISFTVCTADASFGTGPNHGRQEFTLGVSFHNGQVQGTFSAPMRPAIRALKTLEGLRKLRYQLKSQ